MALATDALDAEIHQLVDVLAIARPGEDRQRRAGQRVADRDGHLDAQVPRDFAGLGPDLRLRPLDPFYRIWWTGDPRHFDFCGPADRVKAKPMNLVPPLWTAWR